MFGEVNCCQGTGLADGSADDGSVSSHMAVDGPEAFGDSLIDEPELTTVTMRMTLDRWPDGGLTKWTKTVRSTSSEDDLNGFAVDYDYCVGRAVMELMAVMAVLCDDHLFRVVDQYHRQTKNGTTEKRGGDVSRTLEALV